MPSQSVLRIPIGPNATKQLKRIAQDRKISVSELIRRCVQAQLAQKGIDIDMSEGLETWGGNRQGEAE